MRQLNIATKNQMGHQEDVGEGDEARKHMGTHAMMASDIIESLKEVWNKMENK